ncbi:glutamine amidotransferase [Candidatus Curtissbacteria bacterium]|nr:glutamine amidotransferase [Candidatus Curtissbacteria bacterium]
MTLNICHLYPDLMDTYGDKGNIITLQKRCEWRDLKTTYTAISLGNVLEPNKFDIYFFGGGQDRQQGLIGKDLAEKSAAIKKAVESGAALLSICGGYQLLCNYFKTKDGETIDGIGLFDAHTIGTEDRMIQNLLIDINPKLEIEGKLIGFENHSGKTYLGSGVEPLGKVLVGAGNNGEDKTEGTIYKNAFGCYLHGSLLPKNPHFADYLIAKALERRFGKIELQPLDDNLEWEAHKYAIKRVWH